MTSSFTLQERTPGSCLWENMWPPQKSHFMSPAIVMLNELFQPHLLFVLSIYDLFKMLSEAVTTQHLMAQLLTNTERRI